MVKNISINAGDTGDEGQEDLLEEETTTHSSILVWKIPWTEEPGRLESMVAKSQTQLSMHACTERIGRNCPPFRIAFFEHNPGCLDVYIHMNFY